MTTPPVTAVTYCRISADKLELGAGVDRQRADTDRVCEERGLRIIERVVDNDRSASKYARKAREGWLHVLEMLSSDQVGALVAYDLDRLTRKPDELAPLIAAAERGVKIITVTGSVLNLSTADGIFAARILLAVAEKEAANASRRQSAKLRHDAMAGRPHWPRRPFGFQLDTTVVEAEATWVRSMVDWIANEGISATECAVRLNAANVAQPSGKPWQSAGVKMLVTSPRIIGVRTYKGDVIGPASWHALVDETDWRRACASLAARSQGTRQGRRSMLTGLVKCGRCGAKMTRTNTGDKAEYRCTKHADVGTGCGQAINAPALEHHVSQMVLVALGDVTASIPAPLDGVDDIDSLRADLASVAEMFGRGELTMQEFRAARSPLTARLNAAATTTAINDTATALARLAGDQPTLAARWPDIDVDLRRRLISLVVDHFVVAPAARRRLDLSRVTTTWRTEFMSGER